jgi:hypothetical protein
MQLASHTVRRALGGDGDAAGPGAGGGADLTQ